METKEWFRRHPRPRLTPAEPTDPRHLRFSDNLVIVCAAFCAAVAAMSLVYAAADAAPAVAMAPFTAVVFLLCSGALVIGRDGASYRFIPEGWGPRLALWVPAGLGVLGLALYISPRLGIDFGAASSSGFTFMLMGGALALRRTTVPALRALAVGFVLFFLALLFVVLLWLAFSVSTPGVPVPTFSGIALFSVIAFVALFFGMLLLEVPNGFLRVAITETPAGVLTRRLLPVGFIVPPVLGWLRLQGEFRGLYTTTVGTTLFASALVAVFCIVTGLSARGFRQLDVRRREAEAAKHRSEQWFVTAFNASPAALAITDAATGVFVDLNPAAEKLFGYPRAEAVGKSSLDLGLVKQNVGQELVDRVAKEGRSEGSELPLRTKQGADITVLASIEKLDYAGRPVLMTALIDITDRKQQEDEVRRSRNALAEAQRIGKVGSWEWDPTKDVAQWSDQMYRIFGVDQADRALGYAQAQGYIHPEDRERFASDVKDALDGKGPYESYYRILRGGSEVRFLHSQGEVTRGPDGKVVRMVGFVEDITERKAAEEQILRSREDIAAKAVELERSNAELEQFAYVASHDLQEPLRMVASYVQLLKKRYAGKLDADADEFIQYAFEGSTRMQGLINDLLTYSRVGTRGKPFATVDVGKAVAQALENLQVAIEESRAFVQIEKLPTLKADETQLVQLFQNLVSNAIKYRGPEPPHIQITAEPDASGWRFAVRDNGIGIDPKHFDRIFIIFQRLQARDETSGTGIGLALCKKIVERHGGHIWVESAPGEGSTFRFTIPGAAPRGGKTA